MKQHKTTLLIVDDNEDDRFFLAKAFRAASKRYIIHTLSNGDEALRYLKGLDQYSNHAKFEFPSYIITDLSMSPGDGFLILDFIKLHPALSVIPVVMLSSSDNPDDIRTAYFLGASSYFVKPSSNSKLSALVQKIHEYWAECEIPEVDESGYALVTSSRGRLGESYSKPKPPLKSR